jgi:hypothetical protein
MSGQRDEDGEVGGWSERVDAACSWGGLRAITYVHDAVRCVIEFTHGCALAAEGRAHFEASARMTA